MIIKAIMDCSILQSILKSNTGTAKGFWETNASWIFPLVVTIIFSLLGLINTFRQRRLIEWQVGIGLMEKRLNTFYRERKALESIICNEKPDSSTLSDLCYVQTETRFLFERDICDHIDKVLQLTEDRVKYDRPKVPDGLGGFVEQPQAQIEKEFSDRAAELFGEALTLYSRYIHFNSIGVSKKRGK